MADKIAKNATIRHKSDLTVSFSKTDIRTLSNRDGRKA